MVCEIIAFCFPNALVLTLRKENITAVFVFLFQGMWELYIISLTNTKVRILPIYLWPILIPLENYFVCPTSLNGE